MSAETVAEAIAERLLGSVPSYWDGRQSILQMRAEGSKQWRQMEWIGWYFEHLCHSALRGVLEMPGPRYGNAGFDGYCEAPWDFKSHASQSGTKVIVNDQEAIDLAIQQHGWVGLILVSGDAAYDDDERSFQSWHSVLKGGQSDYERERVARGARSRRRKAAYAADEILLLKIEADRVRESGAFQESFRNADGSPRRAKMLLDLADVGDSVLRTIRL